MALPVLSNPALLIRLKKPLPVENTVLAANVTESPFKRPTAGEEQSRGQPGAQAELSRPGDGSQQLSGAGWLA